MSKEFHFSLKRNGQHTQIDKLKLVVLLFYCFLLFFLYIVWTNSFHLMNQELKRTINFCQVFYTIFYYKTTTQTTDSYLVPNMNTQSRETQRKKQNNNLCFVFQRFDCYFVLADALRDREGDFTYTQKGTRHENVPEIHIETLTEPRSKRTIYH